MSLHWKVLAQGKLAWDVVGKLSGSELCPSVFTSSFQIHLSQRKCSFSTWCLDIALYCTKGAVYYVSCSCSYQFCLKYQPTFILTLKSITIFRSVLWSVVAFLFWFKALELYICVMLCIRNWIQCFTVFCCYLWHLATKKKWVKIYQEIQRHAVKTVFEFFLRFWVANI